MPFVRHCEQIWYSQTGQRRPEKYDADQMRAICKPDKTHTHSLTIVYSSCFYMATMVTRTHLNVTLY